MILAVTRWLQRGEEEDERDGEADAVTEVGACKYKYSVASISSFWIPYVQGCDLSRTYSSALHTPKAVTYHEPTAM